MSDLQEQMVDDLTALIDRLIDGVDSYVKEFPDSPRVVHHSRSLYELRHALTNDLAVAKVREARAAEKAAAKDAYTEDRKYDQFTRDMATKLGITPQEFLDLQAEGRERMQGGTRDVAAATQAAKEATK